MADVGVGYGTIVDAMGRRRGRMPLSLQLSGKHGGLPWPRDLRCTQKHPQRDREAVSNDLCVCVQALYTGKDQRLASLKNRYERHLKSICINVAGK